MKKRYDNDQNKSGVLGNTKAKTPNTLRSRGWTFTLNNYTEEEFKQLETYGHTNTLKFILGKEVGKEGTPHIQGYYYHKHPQTFEHMRGLNQRIHWERSKGSPDQNFQYCTKEGKAIHGGFDKKITLQDRIRQKLLEKFKDIKWRQWQTKVLDFIDERPDSRTINWIYDPIGNCGKSFLTKYLALTREIIIADGKKDNIFNQVNRKLNEEEKEFELVILDIPRSSEGYINYGVLEQLKNGLIYSGKYEGGMCLFDDVHVIVFANFMPDRSQFSKDRWRIIEITDKKKNP